MACGSALSGRDERTPAARSAGAVRVRSAVDLLLSHRVAPPPCHAPAMSRPPSSIWTIVRGGPASALLAQSAVAATMPSSSCIRCSRTRGCSMAAARPGAPAAAAESVLHRQRIQADAGEDGVRGGVAGGAAGLAEQLAARCIDLYRRAARLRGGGIPNTGLDPDAVRRAATPRAERPIDLGYRADDAPPYLGHSERARSREYFIGAAARYGLTVDISLESGATGSTRPSGPAFLESLQGPAWHRGRRRLFRARRSHAQRGECLRGRAPAAHVRGDASRGSSRATDRRCRCASSAAGRSRRPAREPCRSCSRATTTATSSRTCITSR